MTAAARIRNFSTRNTSKLLKIKLNNRKQPLMNEKKEVSQKIDMKYALRDGTFFRIFIQLRMIFSFDVGNRHIQQPLVNYEIQVNF